MRQVNSPQNFLNKASEQEFQDDVMIRRETSVGEHLASAPKRVANAIAQEAQENRDFWEEVGIELSLGSEDTKISVGDGVELIISGSVGLDVSGIDGEVLDPITPYEPEFAIVTHHGHPGKHTKIPIELLHDILRRDREESSTIEGEVIEGEDDE